MVLTAAYIRVSTEEQGEYSPAAQLAEIKAFAQKNGYCIPEGWIFTDEGISGRKAQNRPAFQRMIRLARRKNSGLQCILVHKYDRFTRSREDAVLYKSLLKKNGVKVVSVKEPIPEDDKFAVIYESMLEAMAEYYSLNLAEEVHKTMRRKAESGEWQTAAPFGYRNAGKGLAIVPEEAEAVRRLFQQYAAGASLASLARGMNRRGFQTHQGNAFESRTVRYILHNPVYCGYLRWTPGGRADRDYFSPAAITARGGWEAIIPQELWAAAAKRLQNERRPQPRRSGGHWLSGMVQCSACGGCLAFGTRYKNGAWQMQCSGYNHGRCRVSHAISTARLLPALLSALEQAGGQGLPYAARQKTQAAGAPERLLLEKARLRLRKAKEAYLNGVDTIEEYKETKERTAAEIAALENALSAEENGAADEFPALFRHGLPGFFRSEAGTAEEKQAVLRSILEGAVFEKQKDCLRLVFTWEE